MTRCTALRSRHAIALAEVLAILVMVLVLSAIFLPNLQRMRERSRQAMCQRNLTSIGLALAAYHDVRMHYPVGTMNPTGPIKSVAQGYHHNWIAALLPHLYADDVSKSIRSQFSVYAPENTPARTATLAFLLCPSASRVVNHSTCYAGVHDSREVPIDESNDGIFRLNRSTQSSDVCDGLSYTFFVAEKVSLPSDDLGWLSGTRSSLRNGGHTIQSGDDVFAAKTTRDPQYVGGFSSEHPDGAYFLTGDIGVSFRAQSMDAKLMRQMTKRCDGR
jgi:type II secretory pathway pseudopilin PulG